MAANQKSGQEAPAPPRFQIASRLGAFRDTAVLTDPLGTSASFTIHRSGSNAHKAWFRERVDQDPITLVMTEAMLSSDAVVLTHEERELVAAQRSAEAPNPLLRVVDRLSSSASEQELRREAIRRAISTGRLKASDMATRGEDELLEEALFALRSWDTMPDSDGGLIPYSPDAARALLLNDTPLEGAGVDDIVLAVDAWTVEIAGSCDTATDVPAGALRVEDAADDGKFLYKIRLIIPGLTLGRAYQLFLLRRSRELALFRDQVVEAAAKNFEPSSGLTSSSGDGKSGAVPAN